MDQTTQKNTASSELSLEQQIEALLFWKGEPMSIKTLASYFDTNEGSIKNFLKSLEENLKDRGIVLIQKDNEVTLGTSPACSALIEKITKDELSKDLGKAALETLAIILYKGPLKRSEIDYIRGVNSTFILRNLLIRGLIDKAPAPGDQRASVYSASFDLMGHLGVTKLEDLPDFSDVQDEIKRFKETHDDGTTTTTEQRIPTTTQLTGESTDESSGTREQKERNSTFS